MSVDCNEPEAAVFTCQGEGAAPQGQQGQQQRGGGEPRQGGEPQLPYPWERLVDPSNGAAYYFQLQTGESQWEHSNQQLKL